MSIDELFAQWLAPSHYGYYDPAGDGHFQFTLDPMYRSGDYNEGGMQLPAHIASLATGDNRDPGSLVRQWFDRLMAPDASGRTPWGITPIGFNDSGAAWDPTRPTVNINGQQRIQTGADLSGLATPELQNTMRQMGIDPSSLISYDPTYGYTADANTLRSLFPARQAEALASEGFLDSGTNLVMLMAAMAGGFGALAGMGGAGAGLGAGDSIWGGLYNEALTGAGPWAGGDAAWGVNSLGNASYRDFLSELSNLYDAGGGAGTGTSSFSDFLDELSGMYNPSDFGANPFEGATADGSTSFNWRSLFSNPTSPFGRALSGNGSAEDYIRTLGALGSAGLGLFGANTQANALGGVADKYLNIGAPFRMKLAESYMPGFDLTKQDPAFQGAIDQSGQSVMRALSTNGNPYDNPGAMAEGQKYVLNSTILPQLNTYRSQLGGFGGLGINTAGTADLAKAETAGNGLDSIGYGLGQLTNSNSFEDILKRYGGLFGNSGIKLNLGGSL